MNAAITQNELNGHASVKTKKTHPGGPYRTQLGQPTADQLYLLISSPQFKELERAISTVRRVERVMRSLPDALRILNRHTS